MGVSDGDFQYPGVCVTATPVLQILHVKRWPRQRTIQTSNSWGKMMSWYQFYLNHMRNRKEMKWSHLMQSQEKLCDTESISLPALVTHTARTGISIDDVPPRGQWVSGESFLKIDTQNCKEPEFLLRDGHGVQSPTRPTIATKSLMSIQNLCIFHRWWAITQTGPFTPLETED